MKLLYFICFLASLMSMVCVDSAERVREYGFVFIIYYFLLLIELRFIPFFNDREQSDLTSQLIEMGNKILEAIKKSQNSSSEISQELKIQTILLRRVVDHVIGPEMQSASESLVAPVPTIKWLSDTNLVSGAKDEISSALFNAESNGLTNLSDKTRHVKEKMGEKYKGNWAVFSFPHDLGSYCIRYLEAGSYGSFVYLNFIISK